MDTEQLNSLMQSAGLVSSSGGMNWASVIANLIFGLIGGVVLMYGWKNKEPKPLVIGIVMSVFPYFISNTILIYVIGGGLTAALFLWRD